MTNPITITLYQSEDELYSLECEIRNKRCQENEQFGVLEQTEMDETDVTIVSAQQGKTLYEICTTFNRHKLYMFKSKIDEEGGTETVAACNISAEFEKWLDYKSLLCYLTGLEYRD